ncbi:MAG: hypothetical protein IJY62_04520 [Clostridia bacterium]|nr:hypothetical protein [Clostridia bacterium]
MKAFKHVTGNGQAPIFKLGDKAFYEVELSAMEEAALKKEALYDKYYILYEWDFESHADNDGGIDAWDFGEKEIVITPEESILLDGKVIGFYSHKRVFLIEGGSSYAGGRGTESIGGWGDVSSSTSYTLKKKEK